MKKFFTLVAAVMASFSLWAAEPDFESYNWGADDFATVFADHDGIVISSDASAWKGNLGGVQYVALGGGTDMSAASPTPYFGVTAAAGIDSVEIYWCPNGGDATNLAWIAWDDASNFKQQQVDYKGEGPEYTGSKSIESAIWQKFDFSATDEKAILFGRQLKKVMYEGSQYQFGKNKTVNILGVRVWLHETKTIVSTVETLTAVKVNGTAISAADFNNLLQDHYVNLDDQYVTAPVVTYTKHTVITYDDESTKESDTDIEVTAVDGDPNPTWEAEARINNIDYRVFMGKAASHTVTYMYGEEILGTEIVGQGAHPTEYTQYETMPLATFGGWYRASDLEEEVVYMEDENINEDVTYYAMFTKAYAQSSINIEGWIVANGMNNADKDHIGNMFKDVLTGANYAFADVNALDSLNDSKGNARNEAYLGLKIKKQGGYIACNIQAGQTIRVKFGYVAAAVKAYAGSQEPLTLTPDNNALDVLEYTAEADTYVKIETTTGSTVVIKQIMINEPIANVMYPITYEAAEHGTVSGWTIAFPNEEVKLSFTMDEGYTVASCFANNVEIVGIPDVGEFFTMPAEAVTVTATFGDIATGMDNTEATVKAVKVVRNGQLFIEKNGVLYNAQGAVVK